MVSIDEGNRQAIGQPDRVDRRLRLPFRIVEERKGSVHSSKTDSFAVEVLRK